MIKLVLFDLGKVILDFNHHLISERLAKASGVPVAKAHRIIFKTPAEITFEKGGMAPRAFFTLLKKKLDLRLSYTAFLPLWNDIFCPKPGMAALVSRLAGTRRLAMLSNINKPHFDYVKKKFPVIRGFDLYFLSFDLGLRKPDRKIYRAVLKRARVRPEEVVYFDDIPAFVRAARGLGIKAFLMKDSKHCRAELKRLGVL
jgi:glucose-1-phosphatase